MTDRELKSGYAANPVLVKPDATIRQSGTVANNIFRDSEPLINVIIEAMLGRIGGEIARQQSLSANSAYLLPTHSSRPCLAL